MKDTYVCEGYEDVDDAQGGYGGESSGAGEDLEKSEVTVKAI